MDRIVAASGERGTLPTLSALAARVAAEQSRLNGATDAKAFDEAARRLHHAGRPYAAAACCFRAAEALLEASRRGRLPGSPARRAADGLPDRSGWPVARRHRQAWRQRPGRSGGHRRPLGLVP